MSNMLNAESPVLPVIALIVGAVYSAVAFYFWCSGREMRTRGITVQAMVAKKFRKGGGLENYYVRLEFADRNLRSHDLEMKVASRAWHGMREGETTAITYLPDQPERAVQGPRWAKKLIGAILLFFAAVGGLMSVTSLVWLVRMIAGGAGGSSR